MLVRSFPVGLLQCNCTVIGDPVTKDALVVDPGDEPEKVLAALRELGLACRAILNTHTHIDHVGANQALKDATGARLMLHEADLPLYDHLEVQSEWMGGMLAAPRRAAVDEHLHQGDRVTAGGLVAEVFHTPGHTPGSLCFHLEGKTPLLLSGDTLFAGSIGRTDLWGGDYDQEIASIRTRLLGLDDQTRVIPGHGPETTIGRERRSNPFLVSALAALSLLGSAASAVDLDMVTRIRDEAFHRSQVMDTASYLTDVIGPRLTLSPELQKANAWTRDRLAGWGLQEARLEAWGPFGLGWSLERVSVHLVAPSVQPLVALPRAWTPGTDGVVRGKAIYAKLEKEEDFEAWKGKLKGRIALVDAPLEVKDEDRPPLDRYDEAELRELGRFEVGPPRDERREERRKQRRFREKYRKFLREEGALAALEHSHTPGVLFAVGTAGYKKDGERGVPILVLLPEQYNRLVRLTERKLEVELELDVRATLHEGDGLGYNTLADLPGTDKADELVMAGAHLDSWHAGTGATDNAAGCAVVMEAARILKAVGAKPRRTIRFALWTGEEQTYGGSKGHVQAHFAKRGPPEDPSEKDLPLREQTKPGKLELLPGHARLSAYFNVDSGTGRIRGIYAMENAGAAALFEEWLRPLHDLGATLVTMRREGSTDTEPFDEVGLPAFPFAQDPVEYESRTWHSNLDVYDRLKREDLMQAAAVVATIVYEAAMRDEPMPRRPLPR
ncbi:MAG TPA: M20/M25/M40 family metallo-hydrolase [Vicinamibacteria bacterium]|nr:M20/M25/M40 family metallo-hydrolase [Vicinamibacteria bacterium]